MYYSSYDRLFSKHSDTEANHILALYHDDKNVYALRNKNTLDAWNHSLHAKTTWIIPSDLTIQKICMIKSILVIQSLDNLLILNDRQEMIFNKAYGMTTCLSLSMPYLFVAAHRLDILDLKTSRNLLRTPATLCTHEKALQMLCTYFDSTPGSMVSKRRCTNQSHFNMSTTLSFVHIPTLSNTRSNMRVLIT